MNIPEVGFLDGLDMDVYQLHPALSAGGACAIIEECPRAYWHGSPFNPDFELEDSTKFTIGTAAHLALLEPDEFDARTVIIDADDYRTKQARDARDDAFAAGKTPLLAKQEPQVYAIRKAVLANEQAAKLIGSGVSERSFFWRDPATGAPCKCRVDRMPADGSFLVDLKTTGSAHPNTMQRQLVTLGWPQRAMFYLDGVAAVTGKMPAEYWFLVVEADPPHLVKPYRLGEHALNVGATKNAKALDVFARCLATGTWPDYTDVSDMLELPYWEQSRFEDRRLDGEFEISADRKPSRVALATAAKMFEPI